MNGKKRDWKIYQPCTRRLLSYWKKGISATYWENWGSKSRIIFSNLDMHSPEWCSSTTGAIICCFCMELPLLNIGDHTWHHSPLSLGRSGDAQALHDQTEVPGSRPVARLRPEGAVNALFPAHTVRRCCEANEQGNISPGYHLGNTSGYTL